MNEGLKKFEELMKNDVAFQEKLKTAMESYTGEQTAEAIFEDVLVPLAKEYGISASFEEFKEYVASVSNGDRELSENEVNQVAGGKTGGFGIVGCAMIGVGLGGGGGDGTYGGCIAIGGGVGANACGGPGISDDMGI